MTEADAVYVVIHLRIILKYKLRITCRYANPKINYSNKRERERANLIRCTKFLFRIIIVPI
jgi:hypothetical protein